MTRFRETLAKENAFAITVELIPPRGSAGKAVDSLLTLAEKAASSGIVDALSLTDNPGGGPALSPDCLAKEIESSGLSAIVHIAAKDASRNHLESRALALAHLGIENILVMTGDYPVEAEMGLSKPVFDLDSTQLLSYFSLMNEGIPLTGEKNALTAPTNFHLGAVVSPFKATEPEQMLQYFKLEKKIRTGAQYIITQLGCDSRKSRDLLDYMKMRGLSVPVIGSVFILRRGVARVMHRGDVPGCIVCDSYLATLEDEFKGEDKGRKAALERAARQVAVIKGLGYSGAHIEGFNLKYEDVETVVGRAKELENDWEECAESLQFSPDKSFFLSGKAKQSAPKPTFRARRANWIFQLMRLVHAMIFVEKTPGFAFMKQLSAFFEKHPSLLRLLYFKERVLKVLFFDCRDCGDCALPDMFYLCPESQCPKHQRVGPCGGSSFGKCEVHEDRFCVWYEIYLRAEKTGRLDYLRDFYIEPRDWALNETSSWANFYQGRDHAKASADA